MQEYSTSIRLLTGASRGVVCTSNRSFTVQAREASPEAVIARTWAGATRAADADAYLEYLHATGLAAYRATPGNRGVLALRRIAGDRRGVPAPHPVGLGGSDPALRRRGHRPAVFYPEDERFLVARDERVNHYEVVFHAEAAP